MPRLRLAAPVLALAALPIATASAQSIEERIYAEGMQRSQVMETAHALTDAFGPRLTGSPALQRAGSWTLVRMLDWGLTNTARVPWQWGHEGWTNEYLSAHLTNPVPTPLVVEALGWTPSTNGEVTGRAVHLVVPSGMTASRWTAWSDSVRGPLRDGLRGAMVLVGMPGTAQSAPPTMQQRLSDDDARRRFAARPAPAPAAPPAARPPAPAPTLAVLPGAVLSVRLDSMLKADGALVRVNPAGMENGLIRAFSNRSFDASTVIPTVVMRDEDYGRIVRLLRSTVPGWRAEGMPRLSFDIRNTTHTGRETEHNYTAEIPGTVPGEVVMLGGHLDSWHAATGATDNAAGSAVMMEAGRILAAVFRETGTRPRRTIRVALWTGEEQGLLGSRAYVEQTFGTAENPKPAFAGFNGYFNVDSGTGKVRGAVVFGPNEAAERLAGYLGPLDSLGVAGATTTFSRAIGGSDHTAFNNAGLPGISMGQDPIAYFSTTWHTNVDTYERLLPNDLKQAAVAVATAVYRLATDPAPLPRFAPADMPVDPAAARAAASSR